MDYTQLTSSLLHIVPGVVGFCIALATWKKDSFLYKFWFVASLLLLMSGLFHLSRFLENELFRQIFGRLDHIFIWILFATAAYGVNENFLVKERQRFYNILLLSIVTVGIWLKAIYYNETRGWPGFLIFAATFVVGGMSFFEIARGHSWKVLKPYLLSGLIIGIGGLCDRIGYPNPIANYFENHELFHVAVLIGLAFLWKTFRAVEARVG